MPRDGALDPVSPLATPLATPLGRILSLIAARGLSERAACLAAGLSPSTLAQARFRKGALNLAVLESFARSLGVAVPALLGVDPAATPAPAEPGLVHLRLDQLAASPLNPRKSFDPAAIAELADSIAAQGLLQNLVAREPENGIYRIMAGERRFRALSLLDRQGRLPETFVSPGIRVLVRTATDAEHLALAILENLQRVDVNPVEEAEGFARLQAIDPTIWTSSEIARRIGMSQRHVQSRLSLATRLAPGARDRLRDGRLTLRAARLMTAVPLNHQMRVLHALGPNPGEEKMRRAIAEALRLVPIGHAIFPAGLYEGPMHEDPETGTLCFADFALFMRLQEQAVAAQVRGLRQQWAWADRVTHFDAAAYRPCRGGKHAGAVIEFNPGTGRVRLHENLLRRADVNGAARSAAILEVQAERDAAVTALLARIAKRLTAEDAARLLLLQRISQSWGMPPLSDQKGDMATLFDAGGPLARLTPFLTTEDRSVPGDADHGLVWEKMMALDTGELTEALRLSAAASLAAMPPRRALHPALFELAWSYAIAVPDIATWDDERVAIEAERRVSGKEAVA